jgi:diacylglycerol O-acyltransferase / wax synthase
MPNPDRLTAIDAAFLHLEAGGAHMHVASVAIFEGAAPTHDELIEHVESRLHLVPRYRQRIAPVPFGQGRPVWVDDPHFNTGYHVRHTALPAPGGEAQLEVLAGRVFSQRLDRTKPLWEIWLVEGLDTDRFALLSKAHHALVDGISGVDLFTVLFDLEAEPERTPPPGLPWFPRPMPSGAQLLADALLERTTVPAEMMRGARAALRAPLQVASVVAGAAAGIGSLAAAGVTPLAETPWNTEIGPHRRFTWVPADLGEVKAIKNELGGTVNDVVLAVVAGALGRYLRRHGHTTEGVELTAMVPVSVRADAQRGALGNRVAAMWASLPVYAVDPVERLQIVRESMAGLKESGQAVGAEVLTQLSDFAPSTVISQAARLQARQRFFNLVVTNVPGPQFPLFLLGRRMERAFPMVPLARNQGLGIAIMSYDGGLNFGLVGDFDVMEDIEDLANDLADALEELRLAAGVGPAVPPATRRNGAARPAPVRTSA